MITLDQIAMAISKTTVYTYLDATTAATFWTNFATKPQIGFQCITGAPASPVMTTQALTVTASATATIAAATADTKITDPAIVVYDAAANKVIFNALATATVIPADCPTAFNIMFGKVPLLVHRNVLAALPAVGLVYDIVNMKKLDTTLKDLADADKTSFKTSFITDK